ncbi:hypothetical protein GQX74_010291 [Glossina fuscipes]|nr:hypothetical protein GQX74_010291 [Glossina fuscipes]
MLLKLYPTECQEGLAPHCVQRSAHLFADIRCLRNHYNLLGVFAYYHCLLKQPPPSDVVDRDVIKIKSCFLILKFSIVWMALNMVVAEHGSHVRLRLMSFMYCVCGCKVVRTTTHCQYFQQFHFNSCKRQIETWSSLH